MPSACLLKNDVSEGNGVNLIYTPTNEAAHARPLNEKGSENISV